MNNLGIVILSIVAAFSVLWVQDSVPAFKGKTLNEALAEVPCSYISQDGKDLEIKGVSLIVDGKPAAMPLILTKQDDIEPVEKSCFPEH